MWTESDAMIRDVGRGLLAAPMSILENHVRRGQRAAPD